MGLLNSVFFENRSKKWWAGFSIFITLFFAGANAEFDGMYLAPFKPASETLSRYQMMLFCFALLLIYVVPFVFFVRYSCRRMNVSMRQTLIAFFCGWFIPGWYAGFLNDGTENLMRHVFSKEFVDLFGAALTAPFVEETLKVLVVVWFLLLIGRTSRQNFLITGMSVGMGFQISEDLGYVEEQIGGTHSEFMECIPFTLDERIVGGFVSHWCYTAVVAVAIWMIFYDKKVKKGILLLLVPVLNHMLWDTPLSDMGDLVMGVLCAWMFIIFLRTWVQSLPERADERMSR